MNDLERAFKALQSKQLACTRNQKYYDGTEELVYSAARLREAFGDKLTRFEENWCAVVVESTLDRMNLKEFDVLNDKSADEAIDAIWKNNDLWLDADEVHRDALIQSESFVIVWPNELGIPQMYHNPARMCQIFYRSENPKIKRFAAKWWMDELEKWHITLYYPDRLEYWVSENKDAQSATAFKKEKVDARNPYGAIPVFHFRCKGEIENVLSVQDAINKLFSDMMVAAEFGAFKQRWVISNSDMEQLKNAPNQIWNIPAGDGVGQATQVGEFSGEELTKYFSGIDKLANYVSIVTRTPKNYLVDVGAGVSGDALIAMEAPLAHKVDKLIANFSKTWKEIAIFMLKLKNFQVSSRDVQPVWGRTRSEQPIAEMQAVNFAVSSGIPVKTVLRKQGWSKAELAQMDKDKAEEEKAKSSLAKTLLESARNNADANNEVPPVEEGAPTA